MKAASKIHKENVLDGTSFKQWITIEKAIHVQGLKGKKFNENDFLLWLNRKYNLHPKWWGISKPIKKDINYTGTEEQKETTNGENAKSWFEENKNVLSGFFTQAGALISGINTKPEEETTPNEMEATEKKTSGFKILGKNGFVVLGVVAAVTTIGVVVYNEYFKNKGE